MRWWLALILACWASSASAQISGGIPFPGPGVKAYGAASYTGPGDVITGAKVGYSFRAWTSAARGTNAVQVCNAGDVTCTDMATDASSGNLVVTTVGGTDCSVSTCTVKTLYDQSGALGCSSAACNATQATEANRPIFKTASCGGKPCMQCTASSSHSMTNTTFSSATAQTFSAMVVSDRTSTTTLNTAFAMNGGNIQIGHNSAANQAFMFAGSSVIAGTANDAAFHSLAVKMAGASSALFVEGSSAATGNPGTLGTGTDLTLCATSSGTNKMTGFVAEAGFWSGDQSGSFASLSTNQQSYYGF